MPSIQSNLTAILKFNDKEKWNIRINLQTNTCSSANKQIKIKLYIFFNMRLKIKTFLKQWKMFSSHIFRECFNCHQNFCTQIIWMLWKGRFFLLWFWMHLGFSGLPNKFYTKFFSCKFFNNIFCNNGSIIMKYQRNYRRSRGNEVNVAYKILSAICHSHSVNSTILYTKFTPFLPLCGFAWHFVEVFFG